MNVTTKTLALAGSVFVLVGGCGDSLERATVSGTITVDGAALDSGTISLIPQPGTKGPSVGTSIETGRYRLAGDRGPVPGAYRVEIRATRKTGRMIEDDMRKPPDNQIEEIEQYLPSRYNGESQLQMDVGAGNNTGKNYDLTLRDPG